MGDNHATDTSPAEPSREEQALRFIRGTLEDFDAGRGTPKGALAEILLTARSGLPAGGVQKPSSDPAAQREVAAAPAEPAAGPDLPSDPAPKDGSVVGATVSAAGSETSTPPPAMTKEEAAVRLCSLARGADDPATLRALLLGCKALCREGIHKRRNKASRAARGL